MPGIDTDRSNSDRINATAGFTSGEQFSMHWPVLNKACTSLTLIDVISEYIEETGTFVCNKEADDDRRVYMGRGIADSMLIDVIGCISIGTPQHWF